MWTSRCVARSSDQGCLVSGFCSSGRGSAPHFLQTPPRDDALVLHSSFTSIRLDRGLSPPSKRACWAHHEVASRRPACAGRKTEVAAPGGSLTRSSPSAHHRAAYLGLGDDAPSARAHDRAG